MDYEDGNGKSRQEDMAHTGHKEDFLDVNKRVNKWAQNRQQCQQTKIKGVNNVNNFFFNVDAFVDM